MLLKNETRVYATPAVKGLRKEVNVPEPSAQLAVTDQCMVTAQADKRRSGRPIFGELKEIYHPHYSRCLPVIILYTL